MRCKIISARNNPALPDATSSKAPLEIFDAFCGDDFRAFVELEYFNRNNPIITNLPQRRGDGVEIDVAETGTFQVFVICMKMGEARRRGADDLRDGLRFGAHGLHIEYDLEIWAAKLFHEVERISCGVDEIGFGERKRFQAEHHAAFSGA